VLLMAEQRQRVSEAHTARSLSFIKDLSIRIDREPVETVTMSVARHQLSVYDAAYMELALRQILPLASLDGSLIKAARTEGVTVFK
jgi:predicted nucleic acid-binding protein